MTDSIIHDDTDPASHSVSIDGGAYTNAATVNLTIAATDTNISQMYITNAAGCASGGSWEAYGTSKSSWTHGTDDATADIYIKFNDLAGNESTCVTDSIVHDDTDPASHTIAIDQGGYTIATTVDLTLAASDTNINQMYITNTAGCASDGSWEAYGTAKTTWTHGVDDGTATIYIKYDDLAGNESTCISASIVHDDTNPTGESLSIDQGAYTNAATVDLTLGVTEANTHEMYITNTAGCGSDGTWETHSTTKSAWTHGADDATANIYVKFRDQNNQESGCATGSIVHDDTDPASHTIAIDQGDHTTAATVDLTLAASDTNLSQMYITNTAGCAAGGSWEAYATSKATWAHGITNATANIYIKYNDLAGNESTCITDSILHDDTAPTGASVSIDQGAYTTAATVDLTLGVTEANTHEMYITNTAGCSAGGTWEAYATSKSSWTHGASNGTANIYVKFRDQALQESGCATDSIVHDDTDPASHSVSIDGGAYTNAATVNLTIAATDTNLSQMYITNIAGCASGGSWEAYGTSSSNWTHSANDATANIYIKFNDLAGNESTCVTDSIIHDDTDPAGHSVSIDQGAYTTATTVDLTLAATDTNLYQMYVTNTAGCASGGSWEAYGTSKSSWAHGVDDGSASIYIKFNDLAGNESTCVTDSIVHDDTDPASHSISIDEGAYTNTAAVDLTLAATDNNLYQMYITNTAGCASGGNWEAFSTSKSSWTHGADDATANIYIKYSDQAGNESTCISGSIVHDDTDPASHTISIDQGDYTAATTVDLTLAATDTNISQMYITNTAGCASDGTWEAYAASKASWTHGVSNGTANIYIKYNDLAGNESTCITDSIIHDDSAPTGESLSIDQGAYTSAATVDLTLAVTDANPYQMYITNTAGCGSDGTWEAYNTSKSAWAQVLLLVP